MISSQVTFASAQNCIDSFKTQLGKIPYMPRGIHLDEFFFLYATVANLKPARIIESGRALGQSTQLLARFFPDSKIISIELDDSHPDAKVALENLKSYDNVQCLFGDSRQLFLNHVQAGDICVIDGPKDFRALEVAFNTLRHRQPAACFIHDCHQKSATRNFLQKYYPGVMFSDEPAFKDQFWSLNQCFMDRPNLPKPQVTDCGVFACLPGSDTINWASLQRKRTRGRIGANIRRSIHKRLGRLPI